MPLQRWFALGVLVLALVLLPVSATVGPRSLQALVFAQTVPMAPRAAASSASDVMSVKEFGAKGDGLADDRDAITRAVAALSPRGGVLSFPCGTYVTRSPSALVTVTDRNSVTIQGAGAPCTTLQQAGPGNVKP